VEATWEEAYDHIANKLTEIKNNDLILLQILLPVVPRRELHHAEIHPGGDRHQ
jgi:hypothetical protein